MRYLQPPAEIKEDSFVVLFDRYDESFTLALRNGSTYALGDNEKALRYLMRAIPGDMSYLGRFWINEIIDRAYNFHGVQVLVEDEHLLTLDFLPNRKNDTQLIFEQPKDKLQTLGIGALP